ncbi:NAD(P)H-hydrate dehydratase [Celeribacter sp. SCSIO 80788]|uniref:NAD(P)H-hydrate dehydratase n=1 Tax=Celeribacter sp. SCSIO 80788 TaxID=3117013 RepID=UPI003DA30E4B
MAELLTSAQMRAVEKAAIDSGEVTGLELMERAGAGVVAAVFEEWPELALSSYKAVVLCGPGNNGGDGFVIARLLKQRGWEVEVFLYGDPDKLPPDAKVNYERWGELGEVLPFTSYSERKTWACSLVVDALFGTGLTRAAPELGELFWNMEDMVDCFAVEPNHPLGRPAIVAVDIPSGLCADSGRDFEIEEHWWRASATAHLTVSFHRAKLGHYLGEGPQKCGKLVVVDIGLSKGSPAKLDSPVKAVGTIHNAWFDKDGDSHKYIHGHPLILSGLSGKTGAARLSARAALRVGAGLVTLGTPHEAVTEVAAQITAIMLTEIDTPEILTRVLTDKRLNALCIGPGFGVERAGEFLPYALAAKRATVLDADALTALSESETGFADLHENCVLTPHAGEFKRLFPDLAAKLAERPSKGPAYSKVDATREAAKRAGCTVLFKGPDTVIASPNGRCSINAAVYDRAAPWLATAGSGDVIAGLITGLMARGLAPHHAAETAAWLHVEAARSFGPGLIAEDLPEELPKVFRALGL